MASNGQNRAKLVFPVKINQNHFSGQNRPRHFGHFGQKQVFAVKIDQTHLFWSQPTKTSLSAKTGRNQFFPVKIHENHYFLVKIHQDQLFWSKPVFPVKPVNQNHVFRPKWTKSSFFNQNPVFPAKINEDEGFQPKSTETSCG